MLHFIRCTAALLLAAAFGNVASAQALYKVTSPDGRVSYTDQSPVAGTTDIQQLTLPPTSTTSIAHRDSAGILGNTPSLIPMPGAAVVGAMRGSPERESLSNCARTNTKTLSLIRAAEEVVRTVKGMKVVPRVDDHSAYRAETLERQWQYYKSLGGNATSPEQVSVPENPCREQIASMQQKSALVEASYKACVEQHPHETMLAVKSLQIVQGRAYLAMLEKIQEEVRMNPNGAEKRGSGEWDRAFREDPKAVRSGLQQQFLAYRSAGGTAVRLEDVSEVPNPCKLETDSQASVPITARRSIVLPSSP